MQTNGRFCHIRFVIALVPVTYFSLVFWQFLFVGEMMGLRDDVPERRVKGGF